MTRMSIRTTYALDEQTDARIRKLAERWQVSQAEVVRRSVRLAADTAQSGPRTPAEVIAYYRSHPLPRSAAAARRWAVDNRAARQANDRTRDAAINS